MGIIKALFRRRSLEEVLDGEIARHIELQADEYVRQGLSPEAARRKAMQRFGNPETAKEACREQNGVGAVEAVWQDLRFGLRSFAAQPGFTAVALVTLALGIGANTAVFSVVRAVLLAPLPLPEPGRVVLVWEHDRIRGTTREDASYPDFLDIRESAKRFAHLGAAQGMNVTLAGRGDAEHVLGYRVSAGYFQVIGLEPVIGRVFGPGEGGIVLSHALWQRKFDGSSDVIGSAIRVDGFSGTILGVMPPGAAEIMVPRPELWTSLETVTADQPRGQHNTRVFARLRPGASLEQAQAEMDAIMGRLETEYPDDNLGRGATVVPLHEELAGALRPALRAQTIAVVALLLIASLNIANLMLARASTRGHEMAIRASLGAGRRRLARQLVTESLLLAVCGAALGVAVSWLGLRGLRALAPPDIPLLDRAAIDLPTLLAAVGALLGAWLLFGLLPALRASAVAPGGALQGAGRGTASRETLRLRNALVTGQIALAAALVICSGLLIRSFWRLHQTTLGYEPRGAIALQVNLPETRYPWPPWPFRQWPALHAYAQRLRSSVLAVPGVEAATIGMANPARSTWTTRVMVEGRPPIPEGEQQEAQFRTADPDYLRVSGAALRRGRFFEETDDAGHPLVSVVNEAFVRRHFPGEDPLGRGIRVFGDSREIVGVIADVRYEGPRFESEPSMYFPFKQAPFPYLTLVVRSSGDPAALHDQLRQAALEAEPNAAPFAIQTLEQTVTETTARDRFILFLLTAFAALALLLAAVGIYGIVAFTVGRRLHEMAIRICFGARAGDVFWRLVGGTLGRTLLGVAAGGLLAALAGRFLEPLLFQTSARDGLTYGAVAGVFLGVAFLGAALPAMRAVRVRSAQALRRE